MAEYVQVYTLCVLSGYCMGTALVCEAECSRTVRHMVNAVVLRATVLFGTF